MLLPVYNERSLLDRLQCTSIFTAIRFPFSQVSRNTTVVLCFNLSLTSSSVTYSFEPIPNPSSDTPFQWRIYIVKFWMCPPGVQILSISCSFWENLAKSYVGAPPGELVPPPQGNPGPATAFITAQM